MKLPQVIQLISAIVLAQAAGIIGSVFTMSSLDTWYVQLAKPPFNPPNWLFGPIWFILYTLIGVTLYFLWQWKQKSDDEIIKKNISRISYLLYVNLLLNIVWAGMFFGLQNPLYGVVVIVLVWATTALLMLKIWKLRKHYAWLLAPYFLWVTFATILNISIWSLNEISVILDIAPALIA